MPENTTKFAAVFEAVALSKHYGRKRAVHEVSFHLKPGECLGIAGHNGSGKSTLLGLASQTLMPDGGDLRYADRSILGDRAFLRSHMGYIPQQDGLLGDLTVEQTLRYWQSLFALPDDSALHSATDLMGLGSMLKKRVAQLSGGMKKRVSISLALLGRPKILVMDEVLSALDQKYWDALMDYVKTFTNQGGSVLYCSHQREELLEHCQRLLILREGSVVFYDDVHALPSHKEELQQLFFPGKPQTDVEF